MSPNLILFIAVLSLFAHKWMNEFIFCKTLQNSLQYSTYTQAITIELRIIIIILMHRVLLAAKIQAKARKWKELIFNNKETKPHNVKSLYNRVHSSFARSIREWLSQGLRLILWTLHGVSWPLSYLTSDTTERPDLSLDSLSRSNKIEEVLAKT